MVDEGRGPVPVTVEYDQTSHFGEFIRQYKGVDSEVDHKPREWES